MSKETIEWGRFTDPTGELFYCPINKSKNTSDPRSVPDNCVEASTIGRYAGNINRVDRDLY
jgi:hypothetical protein